MRRRALLLVGAALAGGGCLGSDEPPTARLPWIWLRNDRDEAYDVDVVVEADGETVFSDTRTVGPETPNIHIESPVEGAGSYVVRASLDGQTREVDTTEFVEDDETCVGVRFSLLDNGSVDYWTKSMQEC